MHCKPTMQTPATEESPGLEATLCKAFFDADNMQASIATLCESNQWPADPIPNTIITMLNNPIHVQVTAVGWQAFKGKEIVFPFHAMSEAQRSVFRDILTSVDQWNVYEHAMVYKHHRGAFHLHTLDVLEAMCSMILATTAYPDKRMRVAICNILLQRVQSSIHIDKGTQAALNKRLFAEGPPEPAASDQDMIMAEDHACASQST